MRGGEKKAQAAVNCTLSVGLVSNFWGAVQLAARLIHFLFRFDQICSRPIIINRISINSNPHKSVMA